MKDVEFRRPFAHLINHEHEVRNNVAHGRIKAKRAITAGSQVGAGNGVTACKESHIVAKPDKFFSQVGNDPLSATVETRRDALNEGGDLCDSHDDLKLSRVRYQCVQCSEVPRHSGTTAFTVDVLSALVVAALVSLRYLSRFCSLTNP